MNRRSFLASVAASFAAPAAALGLIRREPTFTAEQLRGDLGNWPKNGFYGTVPPGESIYAIIEAEMKAAELAFRRVLAKDFEAQTRISTSEAMRRHNIALGNLLDHPEKYSW